jgi:hypothetical protein
MTTKPHQEPQQLLGLRGFFFGATATSTALVDIFRDHNDTHGQTGYARSGVLDEGNTGLLTPEP